MPEPLSLPSQRVRARHQASRRVRIRRLIAFGSGVLLLATGVGATTAAIASSGNGTPESGSAIVGTTLAATVRSHTVAFAPTPRADALSAASGSLAAGETVTITGTNLDTVTRVAFGTNDATITEKTADSVTVAVPVSADFTAETVSVVVEAEGVPAVQDEPLSYTYEARTGIDRQMEYALAHWDDYNTAEYGDYNPAGGDCMNFVSQTLAARGWEQRSDWYSRNGSATETWRYVPSFEKWITKNAEELGVQRLELDERDQVKIGDLVIFDWNDNGTPDHIQVVSGIVHNEDGTISILMAGHNIDTDYRDLDHAITTEHPGAPAYFWSLPAA